MPKSMPGAEGLRFHGRWGNHGISWYFMVGGIIENLVFGQREGSKVTHGTYLGN